MDSFQDIDGAFNSLSQGPQVDAINGYVDLRTLQIGTVARISRELYLQLLGGSFERPWHYAHCVHRCLGQIFHFWREGKSCYCRRLNSKELQQLPPTYCYYLERQAQAA